MKVYLLIKVSKFIDGMNQRTCKETVGVYSTEDKAKNMADSKLINEYDIKAFELDK